MVKVISAARLVQMEEQGAEIVREKRAVSVDGLKGILEQMEHDAALSERNSVELIASVRSLTEAVKGQEYRLEMTPVLEALSHLNQKIEIVREEVSYRFDIERNQRNYMTSVVVTPVKRVIN